MESQPKSATQSPVRGGRPCSVPESHCEEGSVASIPVSGQNAVCTGIVRRRSFQCKPGVIIRRLFHGSHAVRDVLQAFHPNNWKVIVLKNIFWKAEQPRQQYVEVKMYEGNKAKSNEKDQDT